MNFVFVVQCHSDWCLFVHIALGDCVTLDCTKTLVSHWREFLASLWWLRGVAGANVPCVSHISSAKRTSTTSAKQIHGNLDVGATDFHDRLVWMRNNPIQKVLAYVEFIKAYTIAKHRLTLNVYLLEHIQLHLSLSLSFLDHVECIDRGCSQSTKSDGNDEIHGG